MPLTHLEGAPPLPDSPTASVAKTFNVILSTLVQRQALPKSQKPPLSERKREEFFAILLGGTLMALNAGYLNALAIVDTGYTVSHVTGTTATAGIALAYGNYVQFLTKILLLLCFIFGSFLSGFMISYTSFHLGRAYGRIFLLASALLAAALLLEVNIAHSTLFVYILCVVSGLQNGMTTRYSGAVLRTTHVTGSATDIGIILGRYVRGHTSDMWKCYVLLTLMIAYLLGGSCGALMHSEFGRMAILFNIALYSAIGVAYTVYVSLILKVPIILAALNDNYSFHRPTSGMSFECPTPRMNTTNDEEFDYAESSSTDIEMSMRKVDDARV